MNHAPIGEGLSGLAEPPTQVLLNRAVVIADFLGSLVSVKAVERYPRRCLDAAGLNDRRVAIVRGVIFKDVLNRAVRWHENRSRAGEASEQLTDRGRTCVLAQRCV